MARASGRDRLLPAQQAWHARPPAHPFHPPRPPMSARSTRTMRLASRCCSTWRPAAARCWGSRPRPAWPRSARASPTPGGTAPKPPLWTLCIGGGGWGGGAAHQGAGGRSTGRVPSSAWAARRAGHAVRSLPCPAPPRSCCIDPADRRRIERLEIFDEFEEWRLIQARADRAARGRRGCGVPWRTARGPNRRPAPPTRPPPHPRLPPAPLQQHYCIAVAVKDDTGSGLLDRFGLPRFEASAPAGPQSAGLGGPPPPPPPRFAM